MPSVIEHRVILRHARPMSSTVYEAIVRALKAADPPSKVISVAARMRGDIARDPGGAMDALTLVLAWIGGNSGATLLTPWDEAGRLLRKHEGMFDALVEAGAPVSPPDGIQPASLTPLEKAVQLPHSHYITKLINAGAEPGWRGSSGRTAADILLASKERRKHEHERERCDRMLEALRRGRS